MQLRLGPCKRLKGRIKKENERFQSCRLQKVEEKKPKWHGHIKRMEDGRVANEILDLKKKGQTQGKVE